ncbi:patatin-like phospholipase family protein [Vibrio sp. WXL103]|uniref:patatin-like phospholipase family protein n=1 Tax=unclassified Vibrio TaxID=2614977 RepID=UPI003EC92963
MGANFGTVSNLSSELSQGRFGRYSLGKTALIAQGGGQRGIFTAGVLDAFLMSDFDPFDEFYGTSAGAVNLCAFLSRQHTLGRRFLLDVTTHDEFFSLLGFLKQNRYLNLEWGFERLKHFPLKLDLDLARQVLGERKAFAAVTCANTLKDRYLNMLGGNWFEVLLATCAIPYLYKTSVSVQGHEFYDGGVSAAIPVQQAWRNNARMIVVIRTESQEFELAEKLHAPQAFLKQSPTDGHWEQQVERWKQAWSGFVNDKVGQIKQVRRATDRRAQLNGGRWLFGAQDLYRLSHLLGNRFDSGFADMLLVHYQTYSLTQQFLNNPPDDCFVAQIKPAEPLRSSALMSDKEDLIYDYQLGLDAGYRFVDIFMRSNKLASGSDNFALK